MSAETATVSPSARTAPGHQADEALSVAAPEEGGSHHAETAVRPHHQRDAVANRLARAAGHLEAVRRMVAEGRDCPEILRQIAAVRAALDASAKVVLADHMESCVRDAAHHGDAEQAWTDLQTALETFIR